VPRPRTTPTPRPASCTSGPRCYDPALAVPVTGPAGGADRERLRLCGREPAERDGPDLADLARPHLVEAPPADARQQFVLRRDLISAQRGVGRPIWWAVAARRTLARWFARSRCKASVTNQRMRCSTRLPEDRRCRDANLRPCGWTPVSFLQERQAPRGSSQPRCRQQTSSIE
jgi:hypothetical protein